LLQTLHFRWWTCLVLFNCCSFFQSIHCVSFQCNIWNENLKVLLNLLSYNFASNAVWNSNYFSIWKLFLQCFIYNSLCFLLPSEYLFKHFVFFDVFYLLNCFIANISSWHQFFFFSFGFVFMYLKIYGAILFCELSQFYFFSFVLGNQVYSALALNYQGWVLENAFSLIN